MQTSSAKKLSSQLLQYVEFLPYLVLAALVSLQADWITKYALAGVVGFAATFVVSYRQPHSTHILLCIPFLFLSQSFYNVQYAIVTSVAAAMTLYGPLKSKLELPAWQLASGALAATLAAMELSHPYLNAIVNSPPVQMILSHPYGRLALSVGYGAILQWITMKYLLKIGFNSFHNVEAVIVSQLLGVYMSSTLSGLGTGSPSSSPPSDSVLQLIAVTAWIGFWFFEFYTKLQQPTGIKLSLTSSLAAILAAALYPFFATAPAKVLSFFQNDVNYYFLGYWAACFFVFSTFVSVIVKRNTSNTVARKAFHLMALTMFLPAMILSPAFLRTSLCIAIALFSLIEFIRYSKILGARVTDIITKLMNCVTNDRDRAGSLTLSHLYLLIGCGFALISSSTKEVTSIPLDKMAGPLIVLAVGDSFASIVGSKFGRHKWPSSSSRTIEGSIAGVLTTLGSMAILGATMQLQLNWMSISIATALTFVLEAYTELIDNLILPIFYLTTINFLR